MSRWKSPGPPFPQTNIYRALFSWKELPEMFHHCHRGLSALSGGAPLPVCAPLYQPNWIATMLYPWE